MYIKPILLLTSKKIKDQISFKLSTVTIFIQPILWLFIFLILREENITVTFGSNTIKYVDFLIIGILVWRTVSFIFSRLPKEIQVGRPVLRSVIVSSTGVQVLLWSSIFSTSIIAILIGISILFVGIIVYNLSLYLNEILLASFVYFLILTIHIGIAIIFLSSHNRFRDLRNIEFIITTIFGLLSGVFLPVNLFPYPLNEIAYVLPITQGLMLLRELTLLPASPVNLNLLLLLIIESIIFFIGGLILYRRNIRYQIYPR